MTRYFLHLSDDAKNRFEEVPAEVFNKRQFALKKDGTPGRYSNSFVVVEGSRFKELNLVDLPTSILANLSRILNILAFTGSVEGGFLNEPEIIMFQSHNAAWLVQVPSGIKAKIEKKNIAAFVAGSIAKAA